MPAENRGAVAAGPKGAAGLARRPPEAPTRPPRSSSMRAKEDRGVPSAGSATRPGRAKEDRGAPSAGSAHATEARRPPEALTRPGRAIRRKRHAIRESQRKICRPRRHCRPCRGRAARHVRQDRGARRRRATRAAPPGVLALRNLCASENPRDARRMPRPPARMAGNARSPRSQQWLCHAAGNRVAGERTRNLSCSRWSRGLAGGARSGTVRTDMVTRISYFHPPRPQRTVAPHGRDGASTHQHVRSAKSERRARA
jgi:hypothetical protein